MEEIRQQQQHIISGGWPHELFMIPLEPVAPPTLTEQDEGLEHLSRALRRQQDFGIAIQEEVDEHNGEGVRGEGVEGRGGGGG